jgi:hypothetical protein
MTTGIKVTKPTKDISSTNPLDFVLHSEYNTAVIYEENERSVTIPANSTVKDTYTYPVSFDFVPVVRIYIELTAGSGRWYDSPFSFNRSSDPEDTYIVQTNKTDTGVESGKFYISLHNHTSSQKVIKYRYYIFMNL